MDFFVAEGSPVPGELIYTKRDFAFDFLVDRDEQTGAAGELAYGDLVLRAVRVTGDVVGVSGYDPDTSWEHVRLGAPAARPARLRVAPAEIPSHGALSLFTYDELRTQRDSGTGWIRIGRIGVASGRQVVEFATGCVAELDGSDLVALWLQPSLHDEYPFETAMPLETDEAVAKRRLVEALAPFRRMTHSELATRANADDCVRYQVGRHNVQIRVTWDDRILETVRVAADVDDGTVASVIRPLRGGFTMAPDGHVVGE